MNFPQKPWAHQQEAELSPGFIYVYDLPENTWTITQTEEGAAIFDYVDERIDSEYHARKAGDSDIWHKLREVDSDLAVLLARTDSDDLTLQNLRTHAEQMIDSERHDWNAADSDIRHKLREIDSDLAILFGRTDSDDLTLQDLRTHAEQMIDSERHDWQAGDSDIRHKLREIDSDLAILFGRTDSDDLTLQDLRTHAEQMIDSERHDWKAGDSDVWHKLRELDSDIAILFYRTDSDDLTIQDLRTHAEQMIDSERHDWKAADSDVWHKLNEVDSDIAIIRNRLDSDESQLQYISINYVKTVNGIRPDLNNNVYTSLAAVKTGTEDGRRDSPVTVNRGGDLWVVSADSEPRHDGRAYIYDSENLVWRRVSGFDLAQGDARYASLADFELLQNLLDSEYAKNREMLTYIEGRLDSDEAAIQANFTYLENLLDSEYVKNREMLAYIEGRLDSDEVAIQANLTYLENLLDSEYANNAAHFARIHSYLDSEYRHRKDIDSDMRSDHDSDHFWHGALDGNIYTVNAGNVGIGTTAPENPLHIRTEGGTETSHEDFIQLDKYINDVGVNPVGPSIRFSLKDGNNQEAISRIKSVTLNADTWGDNDEGATNLVFQTSNAGVASDKFFITGEGSVAIGSVPTAAGSVFYFDMTGADDPDGLNRPVMTGDGTGIIHGGKF